VKYQKSDTFFVHILPWELNQSENDIMQQPISSNIFFESIIEKNKLNKLVDKNNDPEQDDKTDEEKGKCMLVEYRGIKV